MLCCIANLGTTLLGTISQMNYELISQSSENIKLLLHEMQSSNQATILHMSWQLSYHDMCNLWCDRIITIIIKAKQFSQDFQSQAH